MTLTDIGMITFPPELNTSSPQNATLDADGEYSSYILKIPKTGTLKKICVLVGTVTTADPINIRIETVSSGYPSGSLYTDGATGQIASPSSDTAYWVALNGSTGVSVTANDQIAIRAQLDYTDGNLNINGSNRFLGSYGAYPYRALYLGGVSSKSAGYLLVSLEYDGEILFVPDMGMAKYSSVSFKSDSTTKYIGNLITMPVGARAIGISGILDADAAVDLILYDDSSIDIDFSTPLASVSLNADDRGSASASVFRVRFPSPVELIKGRSYRVVAKPTTTTEIGLVYLTVLDDGALKGIDALPMGQDCVYTSSDAAPDEESDWTQDTTKRAALSLMIDQIDIPAGGGACASIAVI